MTPTNDTPFENGDVLDGTGVHIGSVELTEEMNIQQLLTVEIFKDGHWFEYKLSSVYKHEEEPSAQG